MSDIKEMVNRLRRFALHEYNVNKGEMANMAADALEAMAGARAECERQYQEKVQEVITQMNRAEAAEAERDKWQGKSNEQEDRADLLTAERDRLKAVGLKLLAKFDHPTAGVTQWDVDELREALGGDAS